MHILLNPLLDFVVIFPPSISSFLLFLLTSSFLSFSLPFFLSFFSIETDGTRGNVSESIRSYDQRFRSSSTLYSRAHKDDDTIPRLNSIYRFAIFRDRGIH